MNFDQKEIFSIRKFTTGTHSARLGKVALASAVALTVALGGGLVHADETAVTANPATNLETAQPSPSAEHTAIGEASGTQTGNLTAEITSPELNTAVDNANSAGVNVAENNPAATYDNLTDAQKDLAKQTEAVNTATEKKTANTEAINTAIEKNAEIDAANKAEAERVDQANKDGLAAVEAANKAEIERVAELNRQGQADVDKRNADKNDETNAANLAGQAEVDAYNQAEIERVAEINRKGQAEVDKRNAEKAAALTELNKEGQAAVDEANKRAKEEADAENARRMKEYETALAKYKDILAENEAIRKRNQAKQAEVDAENARLTQEYEAKLAALKDKLSTDGYLSTPESQPLIFKSEPNAKMSVDRTPATEEEVNNATAGMRGEIVNGIKAKKVDLYVVEKDVPITVTYSGLTNSYLGNTAIAKVVYTYTLKQLDFGPKTVVGFDPDPTRTLYYLNGDKEFSYEMDVKYYDAQGRLMDPTGSLVSFSSLNTSEAGKDYEGVSNFSGEYLAITGSSIQVQDGVAKSQGSNSVKANGATYEATEWDKDGNPLEYYGAIVGKVTNQTIKFNIRSNGRGYVWFAFNSDVKTDVLPPKPLPRTVTMEPEKEIVGAVEKPELVTPELKEYIPKVDNTAPEEYTPIQPKLREFKPMTPPTPEVYTPLTPELKEYTPITPTVLPHVEVPEKEQFDAAVHPVFVKQTPANVKAVSDTDGTNTNGQLVAKGSIQTWTLSHQNLKAGREEITSFTMTDPFPAGFAMDTKATAEKNSAWVVTYDETGKVSLVATEATLALFNANRNQDVAVPLAYFIGSPQNDGGTYENTFDTAIRTPKGEYKVVSNTPVIYTPGYDPKTPRTTPNGENPTPHDNLIQPKKDVIDEAGHSIDGKSVLPNALMNYIAEQDFDQYEGMKASTDAIAKGFLYVDDYKDEALDGQSMVVNSIKAADGDEVASLLEMYHVLSKDSLSAELQKLIADSGISPVGEFYLWVAKDPQAFYETYVQKGLDITYNLSFKIKKEFTEGQITNQTFQIDYGNGYYGNIVKNDLPLIVVHKDVQDKGGQSINNGMVKLGDQVTYKLEGWVIPADRGYDINSYVFVDMLQHSHDQYEGFRVEAKVDFTLADGTEIKAKDDLSQYIETVYNLETGRLESRFKADFLAQIQRDSAFGADGYISVKRIKAGEVVNEYTLILNDNEVLSDKVTTTTLEEPKPIPPVETKAAAMLPSTGETTGLLSLIGTLLISVLGFVGVRKRKED